MRLTFLFLFLASTLVSQTKKNLNDFSFTLHEETVNKVLAAIGQVSGTNDYEVMFIKGKYKWTILNPQINIRPDSSQFFCDALVNVGPFNYKTNVKGDVKITYEKPNDKIAIKITRAIFELYTVVLDKKFHISNIHLEDHFKEPFLFDGPRSFGTSMDVSLPDSVSKKIYVQPTECELNVKWQEVCAICEVVVSDKPIKPQAVPTPKITTTQATSITPVKSSSTVSTTPTKTVAPATTKSVTPQKK